ncbi:MAG: hypothetical protein H6624_09365 [Bdellovibrionaceae bacterium]|nr:hypothetical protein [Bdellovibrionales bacterium]MCB9084543.1 hypothetical protein [Pseudobdellovibrionaceae bacterium]
MSRASWVQSDFEEGKAYSLAYIRQKGIRLNQLAVKRRNGYAFRLFREEGSHSFWVEGPYGERGRTAYLFLGTSPLRNGVRQAAGHESLWKSMRNPGHEPPPDEFAFWRDKYPSFALLQGGNQEEVDRKIVYRYGLWKQNLFFVLGVFIVLGYWVLHEAGFGGWENLLTFAFGGMALFFVSLTFYLVSSKT